MSKGSVAIINWAGHRNFGDEVILLGLKRLFRDWKITVMSDNKGAYPEMNFDQINKHDLFVLGGGELINRTCLFKEAPNIFKSKRSIPYRIYARTPFGKYSWVHKIKIPKIILGCGVNVQDPLELTRWNVDGLKHFDYIGLRDIVSLKILKSFPQLETKVNLFYDLAYSAPKKLPDEQLKKNFAVVVPTDRFSFGDYGIRENNVASKSAYWLKKKLSVYEKTLFLAFGEQDNDDYQTCKQLSAYVENSEILSFNQLSLSTVFDLLSCASEVISYRLHGLILSHIAGAHYSFYPYHWKLQRVYETVAQKSPVEIRKEQQRQFVFSIGEALKVENISSSFESA